MTTINLNKSPLEIVEQCVLINAHISLNGESKILYYNDKADTYFAGNKGIIERIRQWFRGFRLLSGIESAEHAAKIAAEVVGVDLVPEITVTRNKGLIGRICQFLKRVGLFSSVKEPVKPEPIVNADTKNKAISVFEHVVSRVIKENPTTMRNVGVSMWNQRKKMIYYMQTEHVQTDLQLFIAGVASSTWIQNLVTQKENTKPASEEAVEGLAESIYPFNQIGGSLPYGAAWQSFFFA